MSTAGAKTVHDSDYSFGDFDDWFAPIGFLAESDLKEAVEEAYHHLTRPLPQAQPIDRITLPPELLQSYAGTYVVPGPTRLSVSITAEDGQLANRGWRTTEEAPAASL